MQAVLQDTTGGASSDYNLSNEIFVDSQTVTPIGEQDGNIEHPYATLTQAMAAITAGGLPDCVILVTPYDYSVEGPIILPAVPISIKNWASESTREAIKS